MFFFKCSKKKLKRKALGRPLSRGGFQLEFVSIHCWKYFSPSSNSRMIFSKIFHPIGSHHFIYGSNSPFNGLLHLQKHYFRFLSKQSMYWMVQPVIWTSNPKLGFMNTANIWITFEPSNIRIAFEPFNIWIAFKPSNNWIVRSKTKCFNLIAFDPDFGFSKHKSWSL